MTAVHVHPTVRWSTVAVDEGPVNASPDHVRVVVEGAAGHAAYPHEARDPVLALCQIVVSLQQVVSRRMDPMSDAAFTVGWLWAGSADNVIPDRAEAGGTLRVLQPDARDSLLEATREVIEHTARAHGCTARVQVTEGEPPLSMTRPWRGRSARCCLGRGCSWRRRCVRAAPTTSATSQPRCRAS